MDRQESPFSEQWVAKGSFKGLPTDGIAVPRMKRNCVLSVGPPCHPWFDRFSAAPISVSERISLGSKIVVELLAPDVPSSPYHQC